MFKMVVNNYGSCDANKKKLQYEAQSSLDEDDKKLKKTSLLLGIYFVIYVMYLFCGAAVFSVLERPAERAARVQFQEAIQKFVTQNPSVTGESLNSLIFEITKANNNGVNTLKNSSVDQNWSFQQSIFFTSTVLTTIGYGHVTPLTRSGKVFCMLYAMVGIPLTLVLLSALVERLLTPTIWLRKWLHCKFSDHCQPLTIRVLHLFIIVLIFLGIFLFLPAIVFEIMEPDWDYLDSLYYCFISLTTIGLGDFVPGNSPNEPYTLLYKITITAYLFLGITFMMLTLAVFYDIPQLNLGTLFTTKDVNGFEDKWLMINAKQRLKTSDQKGILPFAENNNQRRFSSNQ